MDSTQRAHIEHLLQLNRAHLRELETQQAKLGILAPSGIAVQVDEYQHVIADLERQLAEALPRHNLPPRDYERFVGRQPQLEEVRRLLLPYPKSRHHLVTIDGIGGIGKSALALETAYHARDSYAGLPEPERFEAIVWVSAKRTYLTADGILEQRQAFRALDDLYAAIAQVLDYPAITRAPAEEQRAIVERVLAEQRTLLILDNLETVDDEELLIFLRLLPDPTKAIVTTRHRIDVAYPVRLLGMPQPDALALIGQEAARKGVSILAATENTENTEQSSTMLSVNSVAMKDDLYRKTGGVPLAIVWSIGLMGLGGSVESVLRRLGSGQSDIARFCFDESVTQIRGRDAHKLLLALALFASDASREALGIVAGLGEDEFGRDIGLEELLRLSLVNKDGDRFSLLPLTKSFVQVEAEKQAEWMEGARERWQKYFRDFAKTHGGRSNNWRGFDILDREMTNILAVIESLVSNLRYSKTHEGAEIIDPASIPQAETLMRFLGTVAIRCRLLGNWDECYKLCLIAIEIGRKLNDWYGVGMRCLDIGLIESYRGDLGSCMRWVSEAQVAGTKAFSKRITALAKDQLGRIALNEGKFDEAELLISTAMNDYNESGHAEQLPIFVTSKGILFEGRGNIIEASRWYQQAVDQWRHLDQIPYLALDLLNLGRVTLAIGDVDMARAFYQESLDLARDCGRADVVARALSSLASLEFSQNQRQSAEAHARQALDLFRRLGMRREQAEALLARLGDGTAETLTS